MVGRRFDGKRRMLLPRWRRVWRLWFALTEVLRLRVLAPGQMRRIIGHLVDHFAARRETLCVLNAVYRFVGDGEGPVRPLSQEVLAELRVARGILPLCGLRLDRPICGASTALTRRTRATLCTSRRRRLRRPGRPRASASAGASRRPRAWPSDATALSSCRAPPPSPSLARVTNVTSPCGQLPAWRRRRLDWRAGRLPGRVVQPPHRPYGRCDRSRCGSWTWWRSVVPFPASRRNGLILRGGSAWSPVLGAGRARSTAKRPERPCSACSGRLPTPRPTAPWSCPSVATWPRRSRTTGDGPRIGRFWRSSARAAPSSSAPTCAGLAATSRQSGTRPTRTPASRIEADWPPGRSSWATRSRSCDDLCHWLPRWRRRGVATPRRQRRRAIGRSPRPHPTTPAAQGAPSALGRDGRSPGRRFRLVDHDHRRACTCSSSSQAAWRCPLAWPRADCGPPSRSSSTAGRSSTFCDVRIKSFIIEWIRRGKVWALCLGTPCTRWTTANTTGRADGSSDSAGLQCAWATVEILRACVACHVFVVLENPWSSRLWSWAPLVRQLKRLGSRAHLVHTCAHGCAWFKPTCVHTNLPDSSSIEKLCPGHPRHVRFQGTIKHPAMGNKWRTHFASAYPSGMCRDIARVLGLAAPRSAWRPAHEHLLHPFWQERLEAAAGGDQQCRAVALPPVRRLPVLGWEGATGFWDGLPLRVELDILSEVQQFNRSARHTSQTQARPTTAKTPRRVRGVPASRPSGCGHA